MFEIILAILAGIFTVGAPCILPLLPILLGASVGQQGKYRPLFIALGFVLMFSVTGLTLSFIVQSLHIAPDTLRNVAIFGLSLFGLFMLWPLGFELLTMRLSSLINRAQSTAQSAGTGNFGGFVLGIMLGVIWTPCAGPVLGSILTLIATQTNLIQAGILLFAYAIGAGIPMLIIAYGSQYITTKVRAIAQYSRMLQQIFGVLILLLAVAMFFQYDLVLQAKLLDICPSWNFANLEIFNR